MDEDLLRYSNKIESTDLRQWPYVINWLTKRRPILSDITVRNICESFTHKMAAKKPAGIVLNEITSLSPYVYFIWKIYIYILALEMASPGNQHCATCIGTLSFPISRPTVYSER